MAGTFLHLFLPVGKTDNLSAGLQNILGIHCRLFDDACVIYVESDKTSLRFFFFFASCLKCTCGTVH